MVTGHAARLVKRYEGNRTIVQVHVKQRRRRRTMAFLLAVAVVVPVGMQLFGFAVAPVAAVPVTAENADTINNGYAYTLRVNDVRLIPDASAGDGRCETAVDYGSTCTLLAAAQEANALSAAEPQAKVLVTLAAPTPTGSLRRLDGSFSNSGTILLEKSATNTPTGFDGMIRGSAAMNRFVGGAVDSDVEGSVFWFAGNVVVDLQNRLGIAPPGDGGMSGAVISFTGQDQVLRNFPNIYGAEGVIYVGKTAKNLLIEHGKIANAAANQGVLANVAERAINVVAGSVATQIREVTIDSMWRAGITFVAQAGNAAEAVHGLSVIDSTFSWDNKQTDNAAYGLGTWGGNSAKIDDLILVGSTFKDFRRGTLYDNNVPISGDLLQFGGNSRISGNSFVNTIGANLIFDGANNDIRVTRAPAAGSTVTIDRNVFSNTTAWSPKGPAVLISGGGTGSGQVAVTDNAFYGWNRGATGEVISVSSSGGPPIALDRNTFSNVGGYTNTATNSAELPGDATNPVLLNNTNGGLRTAYPSAAAVIPGACQISVTAQRPQTGGGQPVYPVRVDAFAGGINGADVYLGGALVATEGDWGVSGVDLSFPFSLSGGKVRLQTVDALGRTSPLSRTVEAVGAEGCGPQLWIQQAGTQDDPSWSRFLEYEVMSSAPLADGAIESALNLAASSAAGEIVSVQAANVDPSVNTRWRVTVRADAGGALVLGAAAHSVRDRAGASNGLPANASDAPNNVIRSADPAGVAGTPGSALDASVSYRVPVSLSESSGTTVSATEGATSNASFAIDLDARDSLDRTMQAPVSAVTVQPGWSNLVPDASMPVPQSSPEKQASLLPNHTSMSASDATIDPASRETQISVAAVDNTVVDGARTVALTPTLVSDDPEYNGLVLDGLTVTAVDNDEPAAAKSPLVIESNNAIANGTAANRVSATVRNAAGQAVQNAVVRFALPAGLISLDGADPVQGPATVTAITDAQGRATAAIGSTVSGTNFDVAATVDAGGREDAISGSPLAVRFVPGAASAAHSVLSVTPGILAVDGEPHEATVRVVDAFGNRVSGETVTFATDPAVTMSGNGTAVSASDGIARVTLSTELAQLVTVSAALGSEYVVNSPATVTFGAGRYSAEHSGVHASASVAEANGTHKVLLEARLNDSFGNLIGEELPDVVIASTTGTVSQTEYAGGGLYTATLTATQAGSASASVSVAGEVAAGTTEVRFAQTPTTPRVEPSNGTTVSGWADPGVTVTVRTESGALLATTQADILGRFSTSLSGAVVHQQELEVQAQDGNGFTSANAVLVIDLLAPDAPIIDPSNGFKLSICAEPGSAIVVRDKTHRTIPGTLSKGKNGCVVFSPSSRLTEADGVQVYALDLAGNWSPASDPFVKTTAPVSPETEPSNGMVITGGTIGQTDSIQFLNGDGIPLRGEVAIDERGQFTFTPSPRAVTGDEVIMRVSDLVGNATEVPVPIFSTPPVPAVVSEFTSRIVSGYAAPGSTVSVTDENGVLIGTATAGLDGRFEIALSLAPKRHEVITVVVADQFGNRSEELKLRLSGASILLERAMLAKGDLQVVHGFGYVPGERVTAQLDNSGLVLATAVAGASGNISLEVNVDSSVALGQHTVLLAGEKTVLRSDTFTVAERKMWSLAKTGSDSMPLILAALALLLGASVVVCGRRRNLAR